MSNKECEPEKLWQLIEDQKRIAMDLDRRSASPYRFDHDVRQAWVQAAFASIRSERLRASSKRYARRQLRNVIARAAQSRYPLAKELVEASIGQHRDRWYAGRIFVVLTLSCVFLLLLIGVLVGLTLR